MASRPKRPWLAVVSIVTGALVVVGFCVYIFLAPVAHPSSPGPMLSSPTHSSSPSAAPTPSSPTELPTGPATSDTSYSSLDAALAHTSPGGTLVVHRAWNRTTPLVVDKSVTVLFAGGSIRQLTDTDGIEVIADHVVVENAVLVGVGARTAGSACAICAVGTVGAPRVDVEVRGGVIDGWRKDGVYLEQASDFSVSGVTVRNVAYAGIMVLSSLRGEIRGNQVTNVVQPRGFRNSYGIALTRNSSQSIAVAPRTSDVVVAGNTVNGVTHWEGIDTHGGTKLAIVSNRILNTNVGIALVPCPDQDHTNTYAPVGITVTGNRIDSRVRNGSRSNGIQVVGTPFQYATATIRDNSITGHGSQSATQKPGAIVAYFTDDSVISGNRIVFPGVAGIRLYHSNRSISVLDNTVTDVWSDRVPIAALLWVSGADNSALVKGNTLAAGSKRAKYINLAGIQLSSAETNQIRIDGNDFTLARRAVVGLPYR